MNDLEDYCNYEDLFIDDLEDAIDQEILQRLREITFCVRHPLIFLKILWKCL